MTDANHTRTCLHCDTKFHAVSSSVRVYCSTACVGAAARSRRRGECRERACDHCGESFSYPIARGNDRRFCSPQCASRSTALRRRSRSQAAELKKCKSAWCGKAATRVVSGYCERCYCSARRNGGEPKKPSYGRSKFWVASGYVMLIRKGHPLANHKGHVYEHRFVAHETHSGCCPPCHWCGIDLAWESAVVDHLNEDRADNRPENLVVACSSCNRVRGVIPSFVRRMLPERLDQFVRETIQAHQSR